jgi:hypothetical protein
VHQVAEGRRVSSHALNGSIRRTKARSTAIRAVFADGLPINRATSS